MKEIPVARIQNEVAALCVSVNHHLTVDVLQSLERAQERESSPQGQEVLAQIVENARLASQEGIALCQDCGVTVVFIELGQDVHIVGGSLVEAIHAGVRQGYRDGYLRTSIVDEPAHARTNTGDNTPAVIHTEIRPGDQLKISLMAKGGGSENMSRMRILSPAEGQAGLKDFVVETVELAGGKACPPIVVGVGVGGSFELAPYLAKKSLLRTVGEPHPNPRVAALEAELLERINRLGIGPMGFGGEVTALAVHVETHPAHIASLPVAVNIQCHSARHKSVVL